VLGDLVWFVPFNAASMRSPSRKVGASAVSKRLPYQLSASFISTKRAMSSIDAVDGSSTGT
jgi:hypothetical protein